MELFGDYFFIKEMEVNPQAQNFTEDENGISGARWRPSHYLSNCIENGNP